MTHTDDITQLCQNFELQQLHLTPLSLNGAETRIGQWHMSSTSVAVQDDCHCCAAYCLSTVLSLLFTAAASWLKLPLIKSWFCLHMPCAAIWVLSSTNLEPLQSYVALLLMCSTYITNGDSPSPPPVALAGVLTSCHHGSSLNGGSPWRGPWQRCSNAKRAVTWCVD